MQICNTNFSFTYFISICQDVVCTSSCSIPAEYLACQEDSNNQDSKKSVKAKDLSASSCWRYNVAYLFQKFIAFVKGKNQVLTIVFVVSIYHDSETCFKEQSWRFFNASKTLGYRRSVIVKPLTFPLSAGYINFYPKAYFALKLC